MIRVSRLFVTATLFAIALATTGRAQQPPSSQFNPVKVDVVLSRYQGEKRVSSMPFVLYVNPNASRELTSVRVGMDVPVGQSTSRSDQGVTTSRPESRWVGTNIDCSVQPQVEGRYRVWIQIQDSSVYANDDKGVIGQSMPIAFRSYSVSNYLMLRENQPLQFSVGSDRTNGETIRAEVTLSPTK
jgi:hypothetical protein